MTGAAMGFNPRLSAREVRLEVWAQVMCTGMCYFLSCVLCSLRQFMVQYLYWSLSKGTTPARLLPHQLHTPALREGGIPIMLACCTVAQHMTTFTPSPLYMFLLFQLCRRVVSCNVNICWANVCTSVWHCQWAAGMPFSSQLLVLSSPSHSNQP